MTAARRLAVGFALGRVAIGGALIVAPKTVGRHWIGPDGERDGAVVLARALGVRDMVMGLIALHTAGHPQVGPRWQRTLAACDTVDLLATVAARKSLPPAGVVGTAVIAGVAAAGETWAASRLT